jgi:DNA invertase Pin-like site-specific DNA recombinase
LAPVTTKSTRRLPQAELIKRTHEGPQIARAKGVRMGRKPKLTPHQRQEARQRVAAGNETLREIARSYNVHNSTISRLTA